MCQKKRPRDGLRKFLISMRGGLQKRLISLWGARGWSDILPKLPRGGLRFFQISLLGTPRKKTAAGWSEEPKSDTSPPTFQMEKPLQCWLKGTIEGWWVLVGINSLVFLE